MAMLNTPNDVQREQPVRVLIVAPGKRTEGGITTVVQRIFNELEKSPTVTATWVASHRSGGAPGKIWEALKGLSKTCFQVPRVDLVHIHSASDTSFFRKSIFFWLARLARRPVIWHLHAPNSDFEAFFGRKGSIGAYVRSVMSRCSRVVVLSSSWVDMVSSVCPELDVDVIFNPIPDIAPQFDQSILRRHKKTGSRILYLAHLIQRKGYPLLVEAYEKVLRQFPDSRLVFAGSGEVEQAKAQCRQLGISDNVEFLGWIGDAARQRELEDASLFVLPSFQEGLPMGVLEAMAYALPVVTTPVGGIPDVITDQRNGLLIEPGDIDGLSNAISILLDDKALRTKMGENARKSVQPLSPKIIAGQWIRLYVDVLNEESDSKFAI